MSQLKALSFLLLLGLAGAQDNGYNYPKPSTPRGTYLPPPTQKPLSQAQIAAEGLSPEGEHEPGMPFDFTYAVKDDVGNDFSHNAESDGDVVKGEYRVLLPDGRTQVVKYTADWKNGYNAEITYEGEATYPDPPPRPPPSQRPFRPESDTDIDSQGLRPSTQGYNYPKPTTRPPPPPPRPTTRRPAPRPTTRRPAPPPPRPRPTTRRPPPPPPTTRRTTTPPPPPPGLYGAPSVPFGVRNNPKFGYSK